MTYDERQIIIRAYLRGYHDALKATNEHGKEICDHKLAAYLAKEEFADKPAIDPEMVAHSIPGRLRMMEKE